jgi:hypothetical protein
MPKAILLALLAACGAHTNPTAAPDEQPIAPPETEEPVEEQYFCCSSVGVDEKTNYGHGDGCVMADKTQILTCNKVLYCPSGYTNDEGAVKCPL